jgi:glycosyltransferase involved in cell wall biosynthesis
MIQVSFIIPTLNAQKVIKKCLDSIIKQDFPKSQYEILIIDGGSIDKTISIAKKYNAKVYQNPLKTAEAGKAIGIHQAHGKYICLIDSDNILTNKNWLKKMLYPFTENSKIIGTEPIKFTYRKSAGIIERYSALIGANDPYAFITGVYDRINYLNNKWTGLNIDQIDKNQYIQIKFLPNQPIPTIGANGTIFLANFLKQNLKSNYLFDIDIISQVLNQKHLPLLFAKVKIDIIHTFCESSVQKFIKKQHRRLVDFYTYQEFRQYPWAKENFLPQIKFSLYSLLIFPALFDSIRGYFKKPDIAWFLHPFLCLITFFIYTSITLQFKLGLLKPINRNSWQQ